MTDIDGKRGTGLLQTWVAVEYAYQERPAEERATALAELESCRDAVLVAQITSPMGYKINCNG